MAFLTFHGCECTELSLVLEMSAWYPGWVCHMRNGTLTLHYVPTLDILQTLAQRLSIQRIQKPSLESLHTHK